MKPHVAVVIGPPPGGAAAAEWPPRATSIALSLDTLQDRGQIDWSQILPPTEAALRARLGEQHSDVLHLLVHTAARGASYATVTLADSRDTPRSVTAQALGQLLRQAAPRLRMVVVMPACLAATDRSAQAVAHALIDKGVGAVVTATTLIGIDRFYQRLWSGGSIGEAADWAARAGLAGAWQCHGDAALKLVEATSVEPMPAAVAARLVAATEPVAPAPIFDPIADALRIKRAAGRFDVFLCHNSADKPAVKQIGLRLKANGILPWLDEWELPPGQPWQPLLERQIESIASAAVFFGGAGVGPWHEQEMRGFIGEFVRRKAPVIPVLLHDAPAQPGDLPLFLRQHTWVDFRRAEPDPFDRLLWGVTQQRRES